MWYYWHSQYKDKKYENVTFATIIMSQLKIIQLIPLLHIFTKLFTNIISNNSNNVKMINM